MNPEFLKIFKIFWCLFNRCFPSYRNYKTENTCRFSFTFRHPTVPTKWIGCLSYIVSVFLSGIWEGVLV